MGRKSAFETFVAVQSALLSREEWRQDLLAEHCEVESRTAKSVLDLFQRKSVYALKKEKRDKYVFWTIPKGAVPGGILIPFRLAEAAYRIFSRSKKTASQRDLVSLFKRSLPEKMKTVPEPEHVIASSTSRLEDEMLAAVEAAAAQRRLLATRYVSNREGPEPSNRAVSVYRVFPESPARFVGWCHRDGRLRWYRVDGLRTARQEFNAAYHPPPEEELDAFLFESVDGYHGGGERRLYRFSVVDPVARWIAKNLPAPMKVTKTKDGIDVSIVTTGLDRVAQLVVGLGGAVTIHTPELKEAARALAAAFLEANA